MCCIEISSRLFVLSIFLHFVAVAVGGQYGIQLGSTADDMARSMLFADDHILVSGNTEGNLFEENKGTTDIFLYKMDPSNGSSVIWATQYGSNLVDIANGISHHNKSSSIYQTGSTESDMYDIFFRFVKSSFKMTYSVSNTNSAEKNYYSQLVKGCTDETIIFSACNSHGGNYNGKTYFRLYSTGSSPKELYRRGSYCGYGTTIIYTVPYTTECRDFEMRMGCQGSTSCSADVRVSVFAPGNFTGTDIYLSKFNATDGSLVWGVQYGTNADDDAADVATDTIGDVYITGYTFGVLHGNYLSGNSDVFLSKHSGINGSLIWGIQFGSGDVDYGTQVATNHLGVVIAGFSYGPIFNSTWVGGFIVFITLRNGTTGDEIWAVSYDSRNDDYPTGLVCDSDGQIWLVGVTAGENVANSYYFISKRQNSTGAELWSREYKQKNHNLNAMSIVFDYSGNMYTSGYTEKPGFHDSADFFVTMVSSNTGDVIWKIDSGSQDAADVSLAVVVDADSLKPIVSGYTRGSLYNTSRNSSADIFIMSPNICESGSYSAGYISPCQLCPANKYSTPASERCKHCESGEYSDEGSTHCTLCPGGYFSSGISHCLFYDRFVYYCISGALFTLILLGVSFVDIGFGIAVIISSTDFLSDVLYIGTTFFYNLPLFCCAVVCLFLPSGFLIVDVVKKSQYHNLAIFEILFSILSYFPVRSFGWLMCNCIVGIIFPIAFVVYVVLMFVTGYYLLQTKLFSLPRYAKMWHSLLFSTPYVTNHSTDTPNTTLDTSTLNQALLIEVLLEAIPQIIVQCTNNALMDQMNLIAIFSLTFSLLAVMSALYRFVYYKLWHGLSFSQMPIMFSKASNKSMLLQSLLPSRGSTKKDGTVETTTNSSFSLQPAVSPPNYCDSKFSPPVIVVKWSPSSSGFTLAVEDVGFFSSSGSCVMVQSIDEACEAFIRGVRKGFVVQSVQYKPVSAAADALETILTSQEEIVLEIIDSHQLSNHMSLGAHLSDIVNVNRVSIAFTAGSEVGIVLEERRSLFSSLSMFIVAEVTATGTAADAGVCSGWIVSAIDGDSQFTSLTLEHIMIALKSEFTHLTPAISNTLPQTVKIEFIASTSSKVVGAFQQHLINCKLRQSKLLLLTFPSGIPTYGGINLFPVVTLNNFGLASAYFITTLMLLIIHCGWFGVWLVGRFSYLLIASLSYPCRCILCVAPVRSGWEMIYPRLPHNRRAPDLGAALSWKGLSIPVPVEAFLLTLFGHMYMLLLSILLPYYVSTSAKLWTLMCLNLLLMAIAFSPLSFNQVLVWSHSVAIIAFNVALLFELAIEPNKFDYGPRAACRTIGQFACVLTIWLYVCNGSKCIIPEKLCDAVLVLGYIVYIILFSIEIISI